MKISKIIAAALSLSFLVSTAATTNSNTQNTSITANAEGTAAEQEYTLGDVNNDSQINAVDASSVLSYYAQVSTGHEGEFDKKQKLSADVNNDASINAVDVSCILSYERSSYREGAVVIKSDLRIILNSSNQVK